jgi:hypothetical protein
MKKIIWLIPLLLLFGCATTQQITDLEGKIAKLEKQKASDTMILAEQAGARRFWWRNALIGGGSALDGIPNATLTDGDAAFVMVLEGGGASSTVTGYLYVYVDDDDTAENSPLVIEPNDGGGAWKLVNWNVSVLTSNSADGTHYLDMSNTATLDVGSRADGRCWYAKDNNRIECYDGTNVQYWTATGNE